MFELTLAEDVEDNDIFALLVAICDLVLSPSSRARAAPSDISICRILICVYLCLLVVYTLICICIIFLKSVWSSVLDVRQALFSSLPLYSRSTRHVSACVVWHLPEKKVAIKFSVSLLCSWPLPEYHTHSSWKKRVWKQCAAKVHIRSHVPMVFFHCVCTDNGRSSHE